VTNNFWSLKLVTNKLFFCNDSNPPTPSLKGGGHSGCERHLGRTFSRLINHLVNESHNLFSTPQLTSWFSYGKLSQ